MKLGDKLNMDRVNTLNVAPNAYAGKAEDKVRTQAEKVVFSEPYEQANPYYSTRNTFSPPPPPQPQLCPHCNNRNSGFDFKTLLPMLLGGNMGNFGNMGGMLKPLMSMLGGGKGEGMDMAKIFELFKPKAKPKKEEKKEEDFSSKFDDMIIIED